METGGDTLSHAPKELVSQGREITVAALRFTPWEETNKNEQLANKIASVLQENPTIDFLITPEYSLSYSPGTTSKEIDTMPTWSKSLPTTSPHTNKYEGFLTSLVSSGLVQEPSTQIEEVRKPFVFRQQEEEYIIEDGDVELKTTIAHIQELAKQYQTNIALGTVCEQRTMVDKTGIEHTAYCNTMPIINSKGKIIALRRKITETTMPELTIEEMSSLRERFMTPGAIDEENPLYQLYIQAEADAKKSLSPISLTTHHGDTFRMLPIICRERGNLRDYLFQNDEKIDLVGIAISEGDDRIDNMQELSQQHTDEDYTNFTQRLGFDVLSEKHNSKGVFVMADTVKGAAGIFSVGENPEEIIDTSDALVATCNVG